VTNDVSSSESRLKAEIMPFLFVDVRMQ